MRLGGVEQDGFGCRTLIKRPNGTHIRLVRAGSGPCYSNRWFFLEIGSIHHK